MVQGFIKAPYLFVKEHSSSVVAVFMHTLRFQSNICCLQEIFFNDVQALFSAKVIAEEGEGLDTGLLCLVLRICTP